MPRLVIHGTIQRVVPDRRRDPPLWQALFPTKPYRCCNNGAHKSTNNAQNGLTALLRNVLRLSVYRLNRHN